MPEVGMMHIGELAERTGLSLRTIRHYDQIGLLTPSGRSEGGFRLYTEDDHDQLMLIRRMKPLGYSLEQMGDLLRALESVRSGDSSSADGEDAMTQFLDDANERREKLAQQLAAADEFIDQLRSRIIP
ncbi:MerR family transcriptional regulator [Brevibacterium aurantiacum]|uniref:MerR family transcriptional regulator n=1 Tax=Brevibacterium aurantiacum TaxID=273384 RepID=A0A556C3U1_BREAU|nr:MerR family transcriptional regulator [Brevibacterium aurantiacum]TSI12082.1 MerR family transcriptional regulator [Brevibacterium aurantiacum]